MRFYIEGLLALGLASVAVIALTAGIKEIFLFATIPLSLGLNISLLLQKKNLFLTMLSLLIFVSTSINAYNNSHIINHSDSMRLIIAIACGLALTPLWAFLISLLKSNTPKSNSRLKTNDQ
jgi:hypothetical protein